MADRWEAEQEARRAAYAFTALQVLASDLSDLDADEVRVARAFGIFLGWTDKLADDGALDFVRSEVAHLNRCIRGARRAA